jgi:hypothetical protein
MEERFWRHVDKNGPIVRPELGKCWLWTASLQGKGYGSFWDGIKLRKAAHVVWELNTGKHFPKGKMACHHCDTPKCVRVSHIYVGDGFTNAQDRLRRGRHDRANMTHCEKGHLLSGENVYKWRTKRKCRTCQRIRHTKYCAKRNAEGYWKNGQSHGWVLRKELQ